MYEVNSDGWGNSSAPPQKVSSSRKSPLRSSVNERGDRLTQLWNKEARHFLYIHYKYKGSDVFTKNYVGNFAVLLDPRMQTISHIDQLFHLLTYSVASFPNAFQKHFFPRRKSKTSKDWFTLNLWFYQKELLIPVMIFARVKKKKKSTKIHIEWGK